MTLRNKLKNVKIQNAETIQSYFTRVSQIKEQLESVEEEVENVEIVITTLNVLLGSWDSFIQGMCAERKWLPSVDFGKSAHKKRISTHNKKREDGRNWRSSSHDPKKIPQVMRNMKNSILEEPIIHLSIWIRNYEWRRWWSWRFEKEYTHETNKDKYSIVISWYCFIIFSWCILFFCINDCILLICMWWVSSSWCYTTLHCYLSNLFADILD